jgi:leucyl/phenylalanyl-tRNA--protein transferase
MVDAYCRLHELGWAHSAECWIDDELAGGLYGVAIGRVFFGESMFARRPDASKIAFVHLVRRLAAAGFGMIDCQMHTHHLARFGAAEIARAQFVAKLQTLVEYPGDSKSWRYADTTGEPAAGAPGDSCNRIPSAV